MAKRKDYDRLNDLETQVHVLRQRIDDLCQTIAAMRETTGQRVDGLEGQIRRSGPKLTITMGD